MHLLYLRRLECNAFAFPVRVSSIPFTICLASNDGLDATRPSERHAERGAAERDERVQSECERAQRDEWDRALPRVRPRHGGRVLEAGHHGAGAHPHVSTAWRTSLSSGTAFTCFPGFPILSLES